MKQFVAGCLAGALIAVVVASVPLAKAQNNGTDVQAPFRVLSASGAVIMTVDEDSGYPVLTMLGPGLAKVRIGVNDANPGVQIINGAGNSAASMGVAADTHGGAVKVANASGQLVAYMQGSQSSSGLVAVKLETQDVVRLEANSSGTGGKVVVGDTNGNVAAQLGLLSNGSGAVCTFDGQGQHC